MIVVDLVVLKDLPVLEGSWDHILIWLQEHSDLGVRGFLDFHDYLAIKFGISRDFHPAEVAGAPPAPRSDGVPFVILFRYIDLFGPVSIGTSLRRQSEILIIVTSYIVCAKSVFSDTLLKIFRSIRVVTTC